MFELNEVTKCYRRRGQEVTALAEANLQIAQGDYLALIGASGSGKTTLLSLLGGMLAPTRGELLLDGESLYGMSLKARARLRRERFGFVFQTFNLVPYLTALGNVQVPMMLAGMPPAQQHEKATQLLSRFGLADRMSHRPGELSVGQQQRVALARTLANDPSVILADEPTGNLDPHTRDSVLESLDAFHGEGRTIIVVTHDPAVAARAQRRVTLCEGRMAEEGMPRLMASA